MKKLYTVGFIALSVFGSLLSLCSENWFAMWVGMEISTLSFLAIMASKTSFIMLVSSWKYLLFQSVGSMVIFLPLMFPSIGETTPLSVMTAIGLGMKLGFTPFQGWLLHVTEVDLLVLFLLCSLQKLTPLVIMANLQTMTWTWFQVLIILSSMWSATMSIGIMSVKKIIMFSSMLMTCWMSCSLMGWGVVVMFFIVYTIHLLFFMLSVSESPYHSSISSLYSTVGGKGISIIKGLSLGAILGLPPFGVFMMKIELLDFLINEGMMAVGLVLATCSGIMLAGYIKFAIPFLFSGKSKEFPGVGMSLSFLFLILIPLFMVF